MYILYDLAHFIFFILFKLVFGYRIIGRENVPKTGAVILASNHASFLDPPLVGTGIWRRVNFVARDTLFDRPVGGFILKSWKAIPVRREQLDKAVLKTILERLKAGEIVSLFPEGTRSTDENFLPGKPGIGMIVSMAKVPVVPVYLKGSWKVMGKTHKGIRRTAISVIYGRPMEFGGLEGLRGHERYQKISDAIMEEIKKIKNESE